MKMLHAASNVLFCIALFLFYFCFRNLGNHLFFFFFFFLNLEPELFILKYICIFLKEVVKVDLNADNEPLTDTEPENEE